MSEYIVEMYDECEKYFSEYGCKPTNTQGFPLREEIVRCRDCIYYERDPNPIDPGWPMMCERTGDDMVEPYGFCAWAWRKEGGE